MKKLEIPWVASSKKAKVIWSTDTIIELYPAYMSIKIDAIEETPVDTEDLYLGYKETKKQGECIITKTSVTAIDMGFDNESGSYDFSIFNTNTVWGFNCESKTEALKWYIELTNWLLA